LWGYVGIDIIQPKQESPIILEINPRLTTSFVGIHQALGFNVAKAVIEMIDATPVINKSQNNKIIVDIQQ
ncbi:MAG: ATP-grasp domain-containing protein, partial [Methylococcales bacterium]|nr:ATP-grasp domain-containing protein [Methylococcales bacterium]